MCMPPRWHTLKREKEVWPTAEPTDVTSGTCSDCVYVWHLRTKRGEEEEEQPQKVSGDGAIGVS